MNRTNPCNTPCRPSPQMSSREMNCTRKVMSERCCPPTSQENNCARNAAEESCCALARDIPTGSRQQLFQYINEVSFAVYEALLYLDTHPEDQEALLFFREHNRKRNAALREYERFYGPLTIETASDSCSRSWAWMTQPWPWEGGNC